MELRFDGLYQTETQVAPPQPGLKAWEYLRFYKDGTVLSVSSTGSPKQVSLWFHKGNEKILQGRYFKRRNEIRFIVHSDKGQVDYDGIIYKEELSLTILSHITGNWCVKLFRFVPRWDK